MLARQGALRQGALRLSGGSRQFSITPDSQIYISKGI